MTVAEAEFSADGCTIVSSTVSVEYPLCNPGCVTTAPVSEETPDCSQIKNFTLTIVRDRDSIFSCQELPPWAQVSGTSEDGTVQFAGEAIPVTWEITEGQDIAEIVNEVGVNGVIVKGLKAGFATIRATAEAKTDLYR